MWTWSANEEHWSHEAEFRTREEAAAEANTHTKDGGMFWTGLQVPLTDEEIADGVHVDVEDAIATYLYDNYGEWAADLFTVTKEQVEEFDAEVRAVALAWVKRHKLTPAGWTVEKIQGHVACGGSCTDVDCEYCAEAAA